RLPPHPRGPPPQWGFSLAKDGRILRLRGDSMEGPADSLQPDRREDDREPQLQALLRRRPAADGRLADRPGIFLALELVHRDRLERGHAEDRPELPPSAPVLASHRRSRG